MSEEKTVQQIKDARELEAEKTRQQRAEDIAYTINHAVSCGVTDIFVQPGISAVVTTAHDDGHLPKWLHWITHIFEHDHDHDEPAKKVEAAGAKIVGNVAEAGEKKAVGKLATELSEHGSSFMHNVGHWFTGEIIGDVGAVPLTIGVQRFAPGMMQDMRTALEPLAKPMFMGGAKHSAREWGKKNGFSADSDEVKAKEATMYEHEISHLPQAVVWNFFSFPINIGAQYVMFHKQPKDVPMMIVAKTFGAMFSNTALIGGRAAIPDSASKWDQWSGKNIVIPTTKAIGGLFGVDGETVERVAKKQAEAEGHGGWKEREEKKRAEPTTATPRQAIG